MEPLSLYCKIDQTGTGLVGFNLLKEFSKHRKIIFHSMYPIVEANPREHYIINQAIKNIEYWRGGLPCLKICRNTDNSCLPTIGKGKQVILTLEKVVGFTSSELRNLRYFDFIFTTNPKISELLNYHQINKNRLLNLGVDREIFNENIFLSPENDIYNDNKTKFLSIGNWGLMNGHDLLIRAFERAFVPEDQVSLIIASYNPYLLKDSNKSWENMYSRSKMHSKIHVFKQKMKTQDNLANLIASVDCGVFLSRTSSFRMTPLEVLSCGKHLIATQNCGPYLTEENSYIIKISHKQEMAYDNFIYNVETNKNWNFISEEEVEQLSHYMRKIHQKKQSGELKINQNGISTAKNFSWERTFTEIDSVFR